MKNIYIILTCLLFSIAGFSQDKINFKEYSYAEFFEMIENEPSDTFSLKNAAIVFDSITDMAHATEYDHSRFKTNLFIRKDTIIIDKKLELENIFFNSNPIGRANRKYTEQLYQIKFKKEVSFTNCIGRITNSVFEEHASAKFTSELNNLYLSYFNRIWYLYFNLRESDFKKGFSFNTESFNKEKINVQFGMENCEVWPEYLEKIGGTHFFSVQQIWNFWIEECTFYGDGIFVFHNENNQFLRIESNDFTENLLYSSFSKNEELTFVLNSINRPTQLDLAVISPESNIDWSQFKKGVFSPEGISYHWDNYLQATEEKPFLLYTVTDEYMLKGRYSSALPFKLETKLLGKLQGHYKVQHDKEFENAVFMEIKNLETQRLQFLYEQNPSFDRYFKWKVNQFLKIFSKYGTEPSKAITFSVYVILLFALIYLFFPNHWDSHGKNRIRDRFLFFHKYLRHPKGLHDIYLDEQKNELELANQFQQILEQHKTEVPKIFYQAAKPLHKWSVAGTMLFAKLLTKVDFLKGSWKQTDPKVRVLKTSLTLFIFCIALIYDLFIKALNALMLSINTFTTLGFGEIPIKGLPRYLAIIQGFIGWFMLTIFSVSLISQLLN